MYITLPDVGMTGCTGTGREAQRDFVSKGVVHVAKCRTQSPTPEHVGLELSLLCNEILHKTVPVEEWVGN